jgi:streptomycin 6-kinase
LSLSDTNKEMHVTIPDKLVAACQADAGRKLWLDRLPDSLLALQQRWSIELAAPFDNDDVSCSWVAPVTLADRTTAILKVGMPHMEARDEIEGLRLWGGNPTVRLLEADREINAMLLERCEPGTTLRELPEPEQDVVIASLLRRLWRKPSGSHAFRPLKTMAEYWIAETLTQQEHWGDLGLVSEGLHLFRELSESKPTDVLLATDLHAGNVLRAQREPWLLIDPKPFVGDSAYDATQHLLNCVTRLRSKPETTVRRFADLLELDQERVRLWTFARLALQAGNSQNEKWLALARAIKT